MTARTPHHLPTAAAALAEVLEQENQLLAALDLAAAAALLPAKHKAAAAFVRAQEHCTASGGLAPADRAAAGPLGERLRALAAENRLLLERGLAAQERVIAVIARAARRAAPATSRYGKSGGLAGPRTAAPLAISARV